MADLCRSAELGSDFKSITTGFSGTDDLSVLLPRTIRQENMPDLEKTNGIQLRSFLRQENNNYRYVESADDTSSEILAILKGTSEHAPIDVVLDAGALILNLSNEKFADAWLKSRADKEAIVFMKHTGECMVKTKFGEKATSFHLSPYADDMSKCLLYLDDVHTRGSDFRLPIQARALLTLGKGMSKDKLMQAGMRMRQLGRGQSLFFVASQEVHFILKENFLKNEAGDINNVTAILNWALSNTIEMICHLAPYFVSQCASSWQKSSAYNHYISVEAKSKSCIDNVTDKNLHLFADACLEDEVLALYDFYGFTQGIDKLPNIVTKKLRKFLIEPNVHETPTISLNISGNVIKMSKDLVGYFEKLLPNEEQSCGMLDEEQERELEQELEEEIIVERPEKAIPLQAAVSPELEQLLNNTTFLSHATTLAMGQFLAIREAFRKTIFHSTFKEMKNDNVWVTSDFVNTVKGDANQDSYLKRMQWVVKIQNVFIVISNFEAEYYSKFLRKCMFVFTPLVQRRQSFLLGFSMNQKDPPLSMHILSGSIFIEDACLLKRLSQFLGIYPRPNDEVKEWDMCFKKGLIERDGFVANASRKQIENIISDKEDFSCTAFEKSPVKALLLFLDVVRHRGISLPFSEVGKLLGASILKDNEES